MWVWVAVRFGWFTLPILALLTPSTGRLDGSFGLGGTVLTDFAGGSDSAFGLVIEPGGAIVVAGRAATTAGVDGFGIARYSTTGALDPSFGVDGRATLEFAAGSASAFGLARQPDGKYVTVGYTAPGPEGDLAVARFNPDGTLDATFGNGGTVVRDIAGDADSLSAVAVQSDGKIVAVGTSIGANGSSAVIVRLMPDGSSDAAFGGDGIAQVQFGGAHSEAFALAVQRDAKLLLAGRTSASDDDFALARFNPDGMLDPTFGDGGTVVTDIAGDSDTAFGLAPQPDGKIVAAGGSLQGESDVVALARYDADGSLDGTFGAGGKATFDVPGGSDEGFALALQPDGAVVVAGGVITSTSENTFVVRLTADGKPDTTFGESGSVVLDAAGGIDEARAVAVDPLGAILVAGRASPNDNGEQSDFLVLKFAPG